MSGRGLLYREKMGDQGDDVLGGIHSKEGDIWGRVEKQVRSSVLDVLHMRGKE